MLATLQTFTPYSNIMNYSLEVDVSVITSSAFISIYQIARHHKNQVYDQAQLENQTNQMRPLARATKLAINALYHDLCYTVYLLHTFALQVDIRRVYLYIYSDNYTSFYPHNKSFALSNQ